MGAMVSTILGGVGLFLLGMILLTEGLKALAGDSLRTFLARFTGGRFSSTSAGALLTALVQSSSACSATAPVQIQRNVLLECRRTEVYLTRSHRPRLALT